MLELVSLTDDEADRRVRNYSLGMRQRLGIGAALLGDPHVLILDEPANGLDPAGIRWMRDLLRGYADRGGTVLLSSHLLHEIEVIADDLVVIGNGRIVAQGTKAELLASAGTDRPARTSRRSWPPWSGPASRHPRRRQRAHRGHPRAGRRGRARRGPGPDRAPRRRRRRARGDVPRAHRRHPARRSSSMTTTTALDPATAEVTADRGRTRTASARIPLTRWSASSCARCSTPARASG
jgi:ABC-type multidrug transport system ATPase subunit